MRQAVLANTAALIGGLVAMLPASSPLVAQAAPSACNVDQSKPKELGIAYVSFTRVAGQPAGPARDPLIKSILKTLLDKPEVFASNAGGYNYLLSQALTMAAGQPDMLAPTTRGALGLTTRPTEPFDVIVELDNAYKKWEAAAPSCAADVASARNSEAWLAVTNKAFSFVDKGPADSATFFAGRSLLLAPANPFPHHILATVASNKNDVPTAMKEWKEVIKLAGADTVYRDIRQNALFYLGTSELMAASKASGDAAKAQAKTAAGYFQEFLKANPYGPDAPNVLNNLAEAYKVAGDEAARKAVYADLVANPSKYSEIALANAGVIASVVGDGASAMKLFEGIVAVNPLSRDGLRNYASTLYDQKKYQEMFAPLRKLVEIDPNNYDGIMMFAYAAQGLEKLAEEAKKPVEKKQWTDTLVKYNGAAEKLAARVDITGFTRATESADITLTVEQVGAMPGNYTITMEFLDISGAVVSTATEKVGPIAPKEKKAVTLKGTGKGIVAFRYKPLG